MTSPERTALIAGAGQGMDFGVAKRLAAEGIRVLVNDIDPERAVAAAAELARSGADAMAAPFDVTDAQQTLDAVAEFDARCGGIDILVNNAGNVGTHAVDQLSFRDMPIEQWDRYFSVNLYGAMHCTKAVIDGMCERGWGRIITISSEAGRVGLDVKVSVYGVAKAGAAHLMRHLARETSGHGVTANSVSLGLMDNVPDEFAAKIIRSIPAGRLGSPTTSAGP